MSEPLKLMLRKRNQLQKSTYYMIHLYEMSGLSKSKETK